MLSPSEQAQVEEAIRVAEAGTAGEIVVVIARRAASYRSVPLVAALIGALLTPAPLIWLTGLSASRIFLCQIVVALALTAIFLVGPGLSLVPEALKRRRGREAAAREFAARGLAGTRGRTGVLVYIAVAERYAEIIGDRAVSDRLGEEVWRAILTDLVFALHQGRAADGLVAAIDRIGALLAEHVPARPGDTDELPNRLVLI